MVAALYEWPPCGCTVKWCDPAFLLSLLFFCHEPNKKIVLTLWSCLFSLVFLALVPLVNHFWPDKPKTWVCTENLVNIYCLMSLLCSEILDDFTLWPASNCSIADSLYYLFRIWLACLKISRILKFEHLLCSRHQTNTCIILLNP